MFSRLPVIVRYLGVASALLAMWSGLGMSQVMAQSGSPEPEMAALKKDLGTWKATMKFWLGADGKADATAEPLESIGREENRMLGEYWLVGSLKGELAGQPFEGVSYTRWDSEQGKFQSTWIDSLTPIATPLEGVYDEETDSVTYHSRMVGPDGTETKTKTVTRYIDADHRVMTIYDVTEGEPVKSMEVSYERID